MNTSYMSLSLALCCIFLFPNASEANQSERVRELIKLQRSSSASRYDSLPGLLSTKTLSPVNISLQEGMMDNDKTGAARANKGC